MARPLEELEVRTLGDFTAAIEPAPDKPGVSKWYRGCGKSKYKLKPSLYRNPLANNVEEIIRLEARIMARFKQRSVPYMDRHLPNDWEYLFFMQHFGVPTRLLDWTENPYIALYFAIIAASETRDNGRFLEDAAVWILDPTMWNQATLRHLSFKGGALSSDDDELRGYAPGSESHLMNNEPVAVYGTHNSPRIVAQRGVFTIFGQNMLSMEHIVKENPSRRGTLTKLVLPQDALSALRDSIFAIGVTESVVFPDLDGLSREIRREFGYGGIDV